ncbi:MAG TPA: mandelate racemase/muconate lactonizing enzyme family protein [Pyrinomonadaceae bacterium]|nr:mandelate racemase/muconate lactonizing enzyme family protein [Pyrinomonadaceae bacterium]
MSIRIAGVEVFHLNAPLASPFRWATGSTREREAVLVKIETDAGLTGWGEALPTPAARVISDFLAPVLLGRDSLDREALVASMHLAAGGSGERRGVNFAAIGACEIALWDIAARAAGEPLHKLLGELKRKRVAVYASGLYYEEAHSDPRAEASNYLERGFTRIKMKIGGLRSTEELARISAVRAAIGSSNSLMVDGNQSYDADAAAGLSSALRDLDVVWFEEPLPADDIAGYRRLSARTKIPLAAGENLHGREGFEVFLSEDLLKVAQPNVGNTGGLAEALAVSQAAHANGLRVALHYWGTPVALAASLHLAACLPEGEDSPLIELDCTPNPLRDILGGPWMELRDGTLAVPKGPGIGLRVDEQALMRFCKFSRRHALMKN